MSELVKVRPHQPLYGLEVRDFRNLGYLAAKLDPITVFVGRNNAGKTNLITAVSLLDPSLFLQVLTRAGRDLGGRAAAGSNSTAVGVRTVKNEAIIVALSVHDRGVAATWSKDYQDIARFQVSSSMNSYVVQWPDTITPFDRRRHKRKEVSHSSTELAAVRDQLLGTLRISVHGEWDLPRGSTSYLEREMVDNKDILQPRKFLDQMSEYFELPELLFFPAYGLRADILPSPAEQRRRQLRTSRLRTIRQAVADTLPETKSVGRELLEHIDWLLPPERPFDEPKELMGGAIRLKRDFLPAAALGAGYRSLLSICHKVLVSDVCLIDEPEAYLHPSLQERLIEFLVQQSSRCQLLIATHSSVILNGMFERGAGLFELTEAVSEENGNVRPVRQDDVGPLLDELGVRASQVLQTNAVIWTEGPSDAFYIRRWIELWSDGRLLYGRDFVILPYGGSQLAHLLTSVDSRQSSAESLRRVARHSVYVMDSDKMRETSSVDERKTRLQTQAQDNGDVAWITMGRAIENYISVRILRTMGYAGTERELLYTDISRLVCDLDPSLRRRTKMSLAQRIAPQFSLEDIVYTFDLGTHVDNICTKLKEWRGHR